MGALKFGATLIGLLVLADANPVKPPPVVLWHGMGDSCCNPKGYISFSDIAIGT